MIGFEVHLNGERLYTAGVGETGVMTAGVTWAVRTVRGVASPSELTLEVGGMSADEHLNWASPRMLRVGDQVVLNVVWRFRKLWPGNSGNSGRVVVSLI